MHFQDGGYKILAESVANSIRLATGRPVKKPTSQPAAE